ASTTHRSSGTDRSDPPSTRTVTTHGGASSPHVTDCVMRSPPSDSHPGPSPEASHGMNTDASTPGLDASIAPASLKTMPAECPMRALHDGCAPHGPSPMPMNPTVSMDNGS